MYHSILDTDLYKYTTSYAYMKMFPDAECTFKFTDRNRIPRTTEFLENYKKKMKELCMIHLTDEEFHWVVSAIPFIPMYYWEWLRSFRFEYDKMNIYLDEDNVLCIEVTDKNYKASLYEIPHLFTVPEVNNTGKPIDWDLTMSKLKDKVDLANKNGVLFSEFGTRRRFSYEVQDKVCAYLKEHANTCVGTSNVHFAMKYNMRPCGTHPHEWFMFHGAQFGYKNANYMALENWVNVYDGDLGTALTDTYTTDVFFRNFSMKQAKLFDGIRQDSGDEYKFIEKPKKEEDFKKGHSNNSFVPIDPEWTLEQIVFPNKLKEQLADVISFCKNKNRIINDGELYRFMKGKGCIGINLWGIPGTGKSIAAEAIASELGMKLIQASYSSLMDSLQGNTEKNISALFDTAVNENCLILFDEADGLLSARKTGGSNSESSNLIKSHLLNILDRSTAIVVFTTNFFKSYDRAFVRRILWNIEVPAPGLHELTEIWKLHLGEKVPKDISYDKLSELTLELSKSRKMNVTGGDIRKLTLMFCTQLTSRRYNTISHEVAASVIEKYLDDLQESNTDIIQTTEVSQKNLSETIKNELNK